MMPYDRSLYLEARNKIIHEERLTIDCDQNLQKQFEVKKHLSFLNSHIVFRAFIGNSETPLIRCKVLIRDSLCDVSSDEYILPPPSYIPLNNTEWDPKVSLLQTNDTRNGFYTWIEDELLHDADCENVVNEMKWITSLNQKFREHNKNILSKDQRVYLSMTTSPSRLFKLHYVLRSLDLTLVHTIFITLPLEFKRKDRYTIPIKLLKEFPQIQFLSITQDLGPILKCVSAVEYVRSVRGPLSNNDIFIQLDDDNCYAVNFVDSLVYLSLLNPNNPVSGYAADFPFYGFSNFAYPFSRNRIFNGKGIKAGHIVEGYLGIAYRGIHIDIELSRALTRRDLNPELSSCYLSDDLVLSFVSSFKSLQLLGVFIDYMEDGLFSRHYRRNFHYSDDENALHLKNSDETYLRENPDYRMGFRYKVCYQTILKYFLDFTKENIPYKSRTEVLESLYSSFKV